MRFQQDPVPEARGVPGPDGLAVERAWLRRTLTREFDVAEATVSRILAENPGPYAGPDAMADAVAVRLYLSPLADGLDAVLREGLPCPETSFARCIVAGLNRLPSHRGPAVLRAELAAEDLRTIASRGVLTDWGFTNAITQPVAGLRGTVDILIWSMTGRRTRLLEPADGTGVPARVLFRPGTSFKVLTTTGPGPDRLGRLILRELAADEPPLGHVPFDDLAMSSLQRTAEQWATAKPTTSFGAAGSGRFSRVPGLR